MCSARFEYQLSINQSGVLQHLQLVNGSPVAHRYAHTRFIRLAKP
jgi:hypothetical protein